jgi:methionyl-tRNA formyltransferase
VRAGATHSLRGLAVTVLAGRQAGCVGLLTLAAAGADVRLVVAYDEIVMRLAGELDLPSVPSIAAPDIAATLGCCDLLVSVHGREIVPPALLARPALGAINVHPCLSRYKGRDPIGRLLADGHSRASVGVHVMTERVDEGPVLAEEFVDVTGCTTHDAVYNRLYPSYATTLLKAVRMLRMRAAAGAEGARA